MKSKVLLLDIDYTVHNNAKFKELLGKDLHKEFNLTKKRTISIYEKVLFEQRFFNPMVFIDYLIKEVGMDKKKKITNILWKRERFNKTLYPDVKKFIQNISKTSNIYIFSKGDKKFQINKIQELNKFFKFKNIFIYKDKLKEIKKTFSKIKNKTIFVIDDSPEVINKAKEINKNIHTILIKRNKHNKNYNYHGKILADYKVTNLSAAAKILRSY